MLDPVLEQEAIHDDNSFSMDTSARNLLASDTRREITKEDQSSQDPSYYSAIKGLTKREIVINPMKTIVTPRFRINSFANISTSLEEKNSLFVAKGTSIIVSRPSDKKILETRARKNWNRMKILVKMSVVEQRLNQLMKEKDERILEGQKPSQVLSRKTSIRV